MNTKSPLDLRNDMTKIWNVKTGQVKCVIRMNQTGSNNDAKDYILGPGRRRSYTGTYYD